MVRSIELKRIFCMAIGLSLFILSGCNSPTTEWKKEDFSFYNDLGEEVDFPSDDFLYLSDVNEDKSDEFQTSKKVKIGQRATDALKKYDLSNFSWKIVYWRSPTEEEESFSQSLHEKYEEISDVITHSSDFLKDDAELWLSSEFYVNDNEELVQCDTNETGNQTEDDSRGRDIYSISFHVKDEKINDVMVENKKGNPAYIIREAEEISNALLHTDQIEFGMHRSDVEDKVGELVDLAEQIGFTSEGTDQKDAVKIGGYDFFVSYSFDDSDKLYNIRYVGESSSESYTALKTAVKNMLGEPNTDDMYQEGRDMPYWSLNCGEYNYSAVAYTLSDKCLASYCRSVIE